MFRFVCARNVQQIRPLKITTRVSRRVRQSPKENVFNEAASSELGTVVPGIWFDSLDRNLLENLKIIKRSFSYEFYA